MSKKFFSGASVARNQQDGSTCDQNDENSSQNAGSDSTSSAAQSDTWNRQDVAQALSVFDKMNSAKQQIVRLWRALFVLGGLLLIAIILVGILGMQSKIVPVVVKVNGNNQILNVEQAAHLDPHHLYPEMETYLLEQFVKNIRTVSVDGVFQKSMLEQAVAMTQGAATKTVIAYQQAHNPYEIAKEQTVSVRITSVVPNIGGSAHTSRVSWIETTRDVESSEILSQKQYTGEFTFALTQQPPTDQSILRLNPLGFYIRHISWTEDFS